MPNKVFERKWTGHMLPKDVTRMRARPKWDEDGFVRDIVVMLMKSKQAWINFWGDPADHWMSHTDRSLNDAERYRVTVTVEKL